MSGPFGGTHWMAKSEETIAFGGNRGIVAGGLQGGHYTYVDDIEYFNITATGNASDFGNLTLNRSGFGSGSSGSRGVFIGGYLGAYREEIDYITIASTGNATDFGDCIRPQKCKPSGASDGIKCLVAGAGYQGGGYHNEIEYLTIASLGDMADFGDLNYDGGGYGCCNGIRAIWGGGGTDVPTNQNEINNISYVTTASLGNASDFGDLVVPRRNHAWASNNTRAVAAGGYYASGTPDSSLRHIEYITVMSTGNGTVFGDLTEDNDGASYTGNATRAVFPGGYGRGPGQDFGDFIDYVDYDTTGNASLFGDLVNGKYDHAATSGD
jgi:hypothetical protein